LNFFLFSMLAVQLVEVDDLRMCLGQPGHEPAQRVAEVAHGLRAIQVGVHVQA
jgi:hypothetical protein